jgi:DNA repair exonuclease SbcCD nuclease subunit
MADPLRVLLLADTHLGFDDPPHPRVDRRRRGPDFLRNFELALAPAVRGEVDAVVHGGDLFYRSRVPASLVERAFRPIARVAAAGVPVFIVPGNHERSRIPCPLFAAHRNVFVFDRARTFTLSFAGGVAAFCGFPFAPDVRDRFGALLVATGHARVAAAVRLLCLHQAVEGAKVGTPEFVFTRGADVIRGGDLPAGFAAVLSGHVHRGQRLARSPDGNPLSAPVFYPGSVERTSFAERQETKGYLILRIRPGAAGGHVEGYDFFPLPARPMFRITLEATGPGSAEPVTVLRRRLASLPADAMVRVQVIGNEVPCLTAARLREIAPAEMNVDFAWAPAATLPGRHRRQDEVPLDPGRRNRA